MRKTFINESRFRVLFCLAVLGFLAALIILPDGFRSNAYKKEKNIEKTETNRERFENYDIRTDKRAFEKSPNFVRLKAKPPRKLRIREKNSRAEKKS
jgi:hypothetical protein